MTGRPSKLLLPLAIIRLAVIPLFVLVTLAVTSDGVHAAGSFNPQPASTYSTVDPGSHPDITGAFNIGLGPDGQPITADDTGDYNFGGVVTFAPSSPADGDMPDGAILGTLSSVATLGLLNGACVSTIQVNFTFMKGTTDINNTVEPLKYGLDNDLAIVAGDTAPFDGVGDVNPPPAVSKYPSYLNAIFDPDWVDYGPDKISGNGDDTNGPLPPIKPRFRFVGVTSIRSAGNLWVVLQGLVFEPGTKLPQLPALDPAYGYPSVTVLQTSSAAGSATPPAPSAVTDFCTPLKVDTLSYGVTQDNPATGPNEGGVNVRTLPEAGTKIVGINYSPSQRDADGDGYENSLDSCPFNADTVWLPRNTNTPPIEGDSDVFAGVPVGDGIPDTCDPTPTEQTFPAGGQPTDHDGDGFLNRGDNCPTVFNKDQKDTDKDANGEEVGDGIGDACDTPGTDAGTDCVSDGCSPGAGRPIPARTTAGKGPGTPDGEPILCVKINTIDVGGPTTQVAYSECQTSLPPVTGPGGTIDTSQIATGTGTTAGTGSGSGSSGAGGVGGPASGVGSLSPVGSSVPAWAAIAAGLGVAGLIGSLGTMASRLVKRRRDG